MDPAELLAVSRTLSEPRSFPDYLARARQTLARLVPSDEIFWIASDSGRTTSTVPGLALGHGRHQLSLLVAATGTTSYAWILARYDSPFTDLEVDTAEGLRPVLMAQHHAHSAGAPARLEAPLTGRETDVLALVAQGLTATAIGHRLGISARTVGKHLEHAYAKLGTHDRLLAAQRALALGLLRTSTYIRPRAGDGTLTGGSILGAHSGGGR